MRAIDVKVGKQATVQKHDLLPFINPGAPGVDLEKDPHTWHIPTGRSGVLGQQSHIWSKARIPEGTRATCVGKWGATSIWIVISKGEFSGRYFVIGCSFFDAIGYEQESGRVDLDNVEHGPDHRVLKAFSYRQHKAQQKAKEELQELADLFA